MTQSTEQGIIPETLAEVGQLTYEQGYRDGFVDAHVTDLGPPDEAQTLRALDNTSMVDGWQNFADTHAAMLLAYGNHVLLESRLL